MVAAPRHPPYEGLVWRRGGSPSWRRWVLRSHETAASLSVPGRPATALGPARRVSQDQGSPRTARGGRAIRPQTSGQLSRGPSLRGRWRPAAAVRTIGPAGAEPPAPDTARSARPRGPPSRRLEPHVPQRTHKSRWVYPRVCDHEIGVAIGAHRESEQNPSQPGDELIIEWTAQL